MHDIQSAYALMLRVCGIGILVDSLERLSSLSKYRNQGQFSWIVLRQRLLALPQPIQHVADYAFAGAGRLMLVLVLRIASLGPVMTSPIGSTAFSAGLTVLVVSQAFVIVRTGLGTIGADQMMLVVCGGAWMGTVIGSSPLAARAGLWFVAAQGCLGYVVAGFAKLVSPSWRSGKAMTTLLSTHTYGSPILFGLLERNSRLARALGWSVMLWEATFPFALMGPDYVVLAQFAIGLAFHASIAALMGLNLFLFAFPATYVAIWALRY